MESTATPLSMTSISYLAGMKAMVPPPPASTLPSSAVWKKTPPSSITRRTAATYSALASLLPLLPRAPVYLLKTRPRPKQAAFLASKTLA